MRRGAGTESWGHGGTWERAGPPGSHTHGPLHSPAPGLQEALQVHKVHQQPLNVFTSARRGAPGKWPPLRAPPPRRPYSPLLAGRELPSLTLPQLVVHFGRLVIQPLEVPIGPLKGHVRLDAAGDGGKPLRLGRGGAWSSAGALGSNASNKYKLPPASLAMNMLRVKAIFPNKIHRQQFQIN